jgi:hypothetical protein
LVSPSSEVRDAATLVLESQRFADDTMFEMPPVAQSQIQREAPEPLAAALTALDMAIQRFAEAARKALPE